MNQVKGEVLRKDPLFVSIWYKRFKIRFMCAFMKRKRKKIKSLEIHVSTNSQITIFTGFVTYLCKHSNLLELYWNWYDLLPVNKNRFINKKLKSQFINIEFKRHNLHKKNLLPSYLVLNVIQGGQPWIFDQIPLLLDQFSHPEEVKYLKPFRYEQKWSQKVNVKYKTFVIFI